MTEPFSKFDSALFFISNGIKNGIIHTHVYIILNSSKCDLIRFHRQVNQFYSGGTKVCEFCTNLWNSRNITPLKFNTVKIAH